MLRIVGNVSWSDVFSRSPVIILGNLLNYPRELVGEGRIRSDNPNFSPLGVPVTIGKASEMCQIRIYDD